MYKNAGEYKSKIMQVFVACYFIYQIGDDLLKYENFTSLCQLTDYYNYDKIECN